MNAFLYTFLLFQCVTCIYVRDQENNQDDIEEKDAYDRFTNLFQLGTFDGLVQQSRIVGGDATEKDRYPYLVSLWENDIPFCAGTLLSSEWVLTAAHCYGFATHVHIGRYDMLNDKEKGYEVIQVEEEIPHPDYNFHNFDFDFMLVKLKKASKYPVVKLDDGSHELMEGSEMTVMGWGKTSSLGQFSPILMEVQVDLVAWDTCWRRYGIRSMDFTDQMICASRVGRDACQGDSGGPLVLKGVNSTEDIQIGLVSWGIGCARRRLPGVYALIRTALEFIDTYVEDRL